MKSTVVQNRMSGLVHELQSLLCVDGTICLWVSPLSIFQIICGWESSKLIVQPNSERFIGQIDPRLFSPRNRTTGMEVGGWGGVCSCCKLICTSAAPVSESEPTELFTHTTFFFLPLPLNSQPCSVSNEEALWDKLIYQELLGWEWDVCCLSRPSSSWYKVTFLPRPFIPVPSGIVTVTNVWNC